MVDHDDGKKPVDLAKPDEMRSSLERILMIAIHKLDTIRPDSPEGMIWRNICQITMRALRNRQTGLVFVLCTGGQLAWLGRRVLDVALVW